MRKGPGRNDTWFRVIWIWNHLLKMAAVIGCLFKERFLRFQLLFLDFYRFHHVIWRIKWAKKLKTKNGQNMSSGSFSHDAAQIGCFTGKGRIASNEIFLTFVVIRSIVLPFVSRTISWMTCSLKITRLELKVFAFASPLDLVPRHVGFVMYGSWKSAVLHKTIIKCWPPSYRQ